MGIRVDEDVEKLELSDLTGGIVKQYITPLEHSLSILQNVKYGITRRSSNFCPWYKSEK